MAGLLMTTVHAAHAGWRGVMQVALNVVTLAFLVVASTCAVLIPVMLYIFWLKPSGWQWYDAALFGSIIASTDAVAIVAVLKKSALPPPHPDSFQCHCLLTCDGLHSGQSNNL